MTTTETHFAERIGNMPESFIREILKVAARPEMISFAGGLPNPAFFPAEKMAIAAEKVLAKDGRVVLQYAPTEGYLPLRDFIAQRQNKKSGSNVTAEDVIILNGSQQGLDLVGKLLINPGSDILLEQPSYLGAIQAFSAYQPTFHDVKMEEEGPLLIDLEESLQRFDPILFYSIPNFQNPTGKTYDQEHRVGVAEAIQRNNRAIVLEDNPYGDIYFESNNLPDIFSLIPGRTIQLGSFSKIISPGLRLGWAIGSKEIIKKMNIAKQASDLHSSNFGQRILHQFLLDNSLDEHLQSIRTFYQDQANYMTSLMQHLFPKEVSWTIPKGGMFIWVTLPEALNATDLLNDAIAEGVLFVPGENFFLDGKGKNTIRINFSNPTRSQMDKGIDILAKLISNKLS